MLMMGLVVVWYNMSCCTLPKKTRVAAGVVRNIWVCSWLLKTSSLNVKEGNVSLFLKCQMRNANFCSWLLCTTNEKCILLVVATIVTKLYS